MLRHFLNEDELSYTADFYHHGTCGGCDDINLTD